MAAKPIDRTQLEDVLERAGLSERQRRKVHDANEHRDGGHGASQPPQVEIPAL